MSSNNKNNKVNNNECYINNKDKIFERRRKLMEDKPKWLHKFNDSDKKENNLERQIKRLNSMLVKPIGKVEHLIGQGKILALGDDCSPGHEHGLEHEGKTPFVGQ